MALLKILSVLFALVLMANAQCDADQVQACSANFTNKYPDAGTFDSFYDENTLMEVCKDYKKASDCVKDNIEGCPDLVKQAWASVDNILRFLCSDKSMKVIKDNTQCLKDKKDDLDDDLKECSEKFDPTKTGNELCSGLKTLVKCTADKAGEKCGDDVSEFFIGFMKVTWEGLTANLTDCNITPEETSGGSRVTHYSFLALTVAVILGFFIHK